ncbi:MAG: hypothetical protein ACJ8M1_13180 [Chthoniobacterales bacterium]
MNCTYLLPIRRSTFNNAEAQTIASYLAVIRSEVSEIILVDGSPADVFNAQGALWSGVCRHERVDRRFGFLNDKVNGIQTGVRLAANEHIILADDDIRYTPADIEQIIVLLERFEVVRPQNYFRFRNVASVAGRGSLSASARNAGGNQDEDQWPAASATDHGQDAQATGGIPARMEASRMLINRATLRTADYPGTCAFRRGTFLRSGRYDGDVLFDNEELIRHLVRGGAQTCFANDLFIRKRPPAFRKWIEQRPRQAYEDFGLRAKTAMFALLPLLITGCGLVWGLNTMFIAAVVLALLAVALAMGGRARGQARRFFPAHICWFAPLWVFERVISTYWAFYWFLRKGGYPFGERLLQKGIGRDWVEGGKIASQTLNSSTIQR